MKRKKNEIQGIRKGGNSLHGRRTGALVLTLALVLGTFAAPEIPGMTNPAGVKVEAKSGTDKKKPTIKFSGKSQITVEKNEVIKIPKTIAKDNKDGNVTKKISVTVKKGKTSYKSVATKIKKNKKVKFSSTGRYTVTYSVKDKAGNKATKKRYITVLEPKTENTTTEAPTSQTTEIPTTTEAPTTTEIATTTEQSVTGDTNSYAIDLSKYGTIEKVTKNGVTYNVLIEANDFYKSNEDYSSRNGYELLECTGYNVTDLAYDFSKYNYHQDNNYLQLFGKIKLIDEYGVDVTDNLFFYPYAQNEQVYAIDIMYVDSKNVRHFYNDINIYTNYNAYANEIDFWNYTDEENEFRMRYKPASSLINIVYDEKDNKKLV